MTTPQAIVIGGSAGALDGLLAIVPALAATLATPIIIVMHLSPTQPNLVPALLRRVTARQVVEVDDKQPLRDHTLFVAPPNYHVLVERDATLALSVDEQVHFSRPSIDVLFESAARALGAGVTGVLLSGANEDGALGLERIADAGGLTYVQDPATARQPAMPQAGIARLRGRGRVATVEQIAAFLGGAEGVTHMVELAR